MIDSSPWGFGSTVESSPGCCAPGYWRAPPAAATTADSGAQETAEALVEARNTGDGEAFCELLSDEVRERLGTENCAAFIEEQSAGTPTKFELVGVDEEGDKAVVTMKAIRSEGETNREAELQIGLEREDGDWRVAALGSPDSQ